MFAILALICFVLTLFHVVLGQVDLTVLGFAFLAAHLVWTAAPWTGWRRP